MRNRIGAILLVLNLLAPFIVAAMLWLSGQPIHKPYDPNSGGECGMGPYRYDC